MKERRVNFYCGKICKNPRETTSLVLKTTVIRWYRIKAITFIATPVAFNYQ
jgi:hypothetical protein